MTNIVSIIAIGVLVGILLASTFIAVVVQRAKKRTIQSVEKELKDPVPDMARDFTSNMPMEMAIAVQAGCEYDVKKIGDKIDIEMKYPLQVTDSRYFFIVRENTPTGIRLRRVQKVEDAKLPHA